MANEQLGKVSKEHDGYMVRYERVYDHAIARVWDAITNPEKMAIWFMDVEMDLQPGAKMTLTFGDEARTKSYGKVLTVEPSKLFEFLWLNEEGGPDELAQWELTELGPEKTKLIFTYSRVDEKYVSGVPAGWHIMLNHLQEVLDGRTAPFPFSDGTGEEENQMKAVYKEAMNQKH
jgi:uncharacterized protein YndB with AHSA1/START domain